MTCHNMTGSGGVMTTSASEMHNEVIKTKMHTRRGLGLGPSDYTYVKIETEIEFQYGGLAAVRFPKPEVVLFQSWFE